MRIPLQCRVYSYLEIHIQLYKLCLILWFRPYGGWCTVIWASERPACTGNYTSMSHRTILRLNTHNMWKCSLGHPKLSDVQSAESCKMPHSCNSILKQYQLWNLQTRSTLTSVWNQGVWGNSIGDLKRRICHRSKFLGFHKIFPKINIHIDHTYMDIYIQAYP